MVFGLLLSSLDDHNRIHILPYVKPTSLGIPLSVSSHHTRSVRRSWPTAVLKRDADTSTTRAAFQAAKKSRFARLATYDFPWCSLKHVVEKRSVLQQ